MTNPVLVNRLRGELVENRYRGAIAVSDARGKLIHRWGDTDALVYPRSAIKLLQAIPLVESGAADHYALDRARLALACSSHSAEPMHTDRVQEWLAQIGLDGDALECGADAPLDEATANHLLRQNQAFTRMHNNCSGKHTGMLTVSRFLDEPTRGYIDREHPAQQRWIDSLSAMTELDVRRLPWSYDGCGIPVIAMPLQSIAAAFARAAAPEALPAPRGQAIEALSEAIAENPLMVAGSGRLGSEIISLCGERILVKSGADGVYTATIRGQGIGIALKIDDGNGSAAEVALLAVLQHLGLLRDDESRHLEARIRVPIRNTRDILVGHLQAVSL